MGGTQRVGRGHVPGQQAPPRPTPRLPPLPPACWACTLARLAFLQVLCGGLCGQRMIYCIYYYTVPKVLSYCNDHKKRAQGAAMHY